MDTRGGLFGRLREIFAEKGFQDLAVGTITFAFTYALSRYYVAGDQVGYHAAYHAVRGLEPDDGFRIYRFFISTMEFVHYAVVYVASNLSIDKNLFFAFLNGILGTLIFQLLRAKKVNIFVSSFFVFTNFYIYVLYFSSERLKLSLIILLFGAFYVGSLPARFVAFALAVAAHITTILLFSGRILKAIFDGLFSIELSFRRKAIEFVALLLILIAVLYYFNEYIFWKFYQYYAIADNGFVSSVPMLACIAMSLYYSKDKKLVIFDYVPLVVAFALLGGTRVNMFAYIIFLRHGLPVNRGVNVGVLATMAYFAYKSGRLVFDVIVTGQGF